MADIAGALSAPLRITGSNRVFDVGTAPRVQSPYVAFKYSGGPANVTPRNSIGGQVSSAALAYPDSQTFTQTTIYGITILHAAKFPAGTCTLQYTPLSKTLTLINALGVSSSVQFTHSGLYAIGDTATGYFRLDVEYSQLPASDTSDFSVVADALDTLFDTPASAQIASGVTEYRALYLVNESEATMRSVVLLLTHGDLSSSVYLGSSFASLSQYTTTADEALSFGVFNHKTMTPPISTSLSGHFLREGLNSAGLNTVPRFPFYPTDSKYSSDGLTTNVERLLADRYDSTNQLAEVHWTNALLWAEIPAGRMVSFWVKRVVPPNPAIPINEIIDLNITFSLD